MEKETLFVLSRKGVRGANTSTMVVLDPRAFGDINETKFDNGTTKCV